MGSSRDGHWLEKEERNSLSLFNLLGLFGGPRHPQPQLQSYEQMSLLRWRANMSNQHIWRCRIGRITLKAPK